jgi:effector-binding domain-containing protein
MKKKFLLVTSLIIIVFICFFLVSSVTFRIKREIIIGAPIINVSGEVTDLKNWFHWNLELKNKDISLFKMSAQTNRNDSWLRTNDNTYRIVSDNAASIIVKEDNSGKEMVHSIFVFPDSNVMVTQVLWEENLTPFNWLKEKLHPSDHVEANLKSLKNYLEDVKQYYGFDIQSKTVLDSLVITKITITPKANRIKALANLYKDIFSYANKNNLGINDATPRMVNFYEINKDSVKIMAGVPVNKKAPLSENISYVQMPAHGKMLVGYYEGDYTGFKKIYGAMNKYIFDNRLEVIAAPYERFLTNPVSARDSLHMKIELCYPTF